MNSTKKKKMDTHVPHDFHQGKKWILHVPHEFHQEKKMDPACAP
jgi:hypothetical protein